MGGTQTRHIPVFCRGRISVPIEVGALFALRRTEENELYDSGDEAAGQRRIMGLFREQLIIRPTPLFREEKGIK